MSDFSEIITAFEQDRRNVSNELKRIRAENEKLRAALKPFVKENYFTTEIYKDRDEQKSLWRMVVTRKELDAAAAALKETGDE